MGQALPSKQVIATLVAVFPRPALQPVLGHALRNHLSNHRYHHHPSALRCPHHTLPGHTISTGDPASNPRGPNGNARTLKGNRRRKGAHPRVGRRRAPSTNHPQGEAPTAVPKTSPSGGTPYTRRVKKRAPRRGDERLAGRAGKTVSLRLALSQANRPPQLSAQQGASPIHYKRTSITATGGARASPPHTEENDTARSLSARTMAPGALPISVLMMIGSLFLPRLPGCGPALGERFTRGRRRAGVRHSAASMMTDRMDSPATTEAMATLATSRATE